MYRAGLESILGFKLQHDRLQINPCVPRWWRDFEITYRRGGAVYRIKVENPLGVSRGVVVVEVDGTEQPGNAINLIDDEKTHNVRIVMGEPVRAEETLPAQQAQA
jgi:cyclic beta-1,2-glucan synthetase